VRTLPEEFDVSALVPVLAEDWGFEVAVADYAPVGAGSYHWVLSDPEGKRGFVTVDDLDQKPWFGDTRDAVFDGLRRAFDTAVALRGGGLGFVVAPMLTKQGETTCRIGPRYSIALFPFVDGQAGRSGDYETADERVEVVAMLAELHGATSLVGSVAREIRLDIPGRRNLESALEEVERIWSAGPFSEPGRRDLAAHAANVAALLAVADQLALDVASRSTDWVITHGEPHARNVMRTGEGLVLIDWDTVALAPPERDLWMLVSGASDEASIYADATGHEPDSVAMNFFRLVWDLADLAAYLNVLRSPHHDTEDARRAYDCVQMLLGTRDPRAAPIG
jgi:spectinomycin phosphotransferase